MGRRLKKRARFMASSSSQLKLGERERARRLLMEQGSGINWWLWKVAFRAGGSGSRNGDGKEGDCLRCGDRRFHRQGPSAACASSSACLASLTQTPRLRASHVTGLFTPIHYPFDSLRHLMSSCPHAYFNIRHQKGTSAPGLISDFESETGSGNRTRSRN